MEIKNDVFDIALRLKEIDADYSLHFEPKAQRYELRSKENNELLLVFPFNSLDERMVFHARKTRRERLDKLIEEIEAHNTAVQKKADCEIRSRTERRIQESAERIFRKGGD